MQANSKSAFEAAALANAESGRLATQLIGLCISHLDRDQRAAVLALVVAAIAHDCDDPAAWIDGVADNAVYATGFMNPAAAAH